MYQNINDYELLYLIAEENEDAYNNMYNKYFNVIKFEANKCFHKIPYIGIEVEDLYMAGLYGLEMAIKYFNEKSETLFYTFASTFIKREIYSYIKKHSCYKHNVLSQSLSLDLPVGEDSVLEELIPNQINEIDQYYISDRDKYLLNLKYELNDIQSLIYELKFNHFGNQEIAILLDLPYKYVDNSIFNIKKRLRTYKNKIEEYL